MAKTSITIREHDHPRMIDIIDTTTRAAGLIIMRVTAHAAR
jgi:hypothetical protein